MKLLLKDGFVVTDTVNKINIVVENGFISEITDKVVNDVDGVINCSNKYVIPGLIDMHVHFREPGYEYKETLESGAKAAIYGGVTTVCCMANSSPVLDSSALVSWIRKRSDEIGLCDILPFACVTKGMQGEELTEMGDLIKNGACGFSDDGRPIMNSEVMRRALEYSKYFGSFISVHEEDINLFNGGSIHEGKISAEYGFRGIPAEAESVMVARDAELARFTGGRVHICHVSNRHSIDFIKAAKNAGINITAEVTHNHLLFTDEICAGYDTNTKINPPLCEEKDRLALIDALRTGVIDCIISDHAPHHKDDKFKEYDYAAFGMIGVQTTIPSMIKLIDSGCLSWEQFVKSACENPAKILGLDKLGSIKQGYIADIAVVDPEDKYVFDENVSKSKSMNTPVWGKELKGRAISVIKKGKVIF